MPLPNPLPQPPRPSRTMAGVPSVQAIRRPAAVEVIVASHPRLVRADDSSHADVVHSRSIDNGDASRRVFVQTLFMAVDVLLPLPPCIASELDWRRSSGVERKQTTGSIGDVRSEVLLSLLSCTAEDGWSLCALILSAITAAAVDALWVALTCVYADMSSVRLSCACATVRRYMRISITAQQLRVRCDLFSILSK